MGRSQDVGEGRPQDVGRGRPLALLRGPYGNVYRTSFRNFRRKLSLIFIWDSYLEFFFFEIRDDFCSVSALLRPSVTYFLYLFCWKSEYILDNISYISVQQVWKKNFTDFYNNTFPT